jgi:hypothetical protein
MDALTPQTSPAPAVSAERQHHPYSPSSLELREACPCFGNRNTVNKAAERGTLQHSAVEAGDDLNEMDDNEAVHAAMCSDFADRQYDLLVEEAVRQGKTAQDVIDLREAYLKVDTLSFSELLADGLRQFESTTAGYVDRILISADRLRAILLDWKFGKWPVTDAEHNLQGIAYLLGLFRAYPTVNSIGVFFLQPQLDRITFHTFTRDQIPALYLRVQTVVARAMEAHQKTDADDWSMAEPKIPVCNFCGNLGRCEKVARFACHVGHKFHPIEIPSDLTPTGLKDPKDSTIGLRLATVLKIWCDAFRKTLGDRVVRGAQPVPEGYVIQTKSNREIVDTGKFCAVALRYLTQAELAAVAEYSFGDVEDLVKDKAPRGSKTHALSAFQQELKDAGAVKNGAPYSFLRATNKKAEA